MMDPIAADLFNVFTNSVGKQFYEWSVQRGIQITPQDIYDIIASKSTPPSTIPLDNICIAILKKPNKEGKGDNRCPKQRQVGSYLCAYHNKRKKNAEDAVAPPSVAMSYVPSISINGVINFIPLTPEALSKPLPAIPLSGLPKPDLPSGVLALPQ